MKLISAFSIALLFTSSLVAGRSYQKIAVDAQPVSQETSAPEISDFEKAVEIIKKYETLHKPSHYPLWVILQGPPWREVPPWKDFDRKGGGCAASQGFAEELRDVQFVWS